MTDGTERADTSGQYTLEFLPVPDSEDASTYQIGVPKTLRVKVTVGDNEKQTVRNIYIRNEMN